MNILFIGNSYTYFHDLPVVFTALANLIGVPAMVSGGVQLMGKHFGDSTLLSLADAAEKEGK